MTSTWKTALTADRDSYQTRLSSVGAELNALVHIGDLGSTASEAGRDGPLVGLPFAVKDNIAVTGMPLSCGSRVLEGLVSPYDATAVNKLRGAGAVPVAKANLDEFGMGSTTTSAFQGPCKNPWSEAVVAGGSSGGSAAAVAAGLVPFALGSDTGGSVRQPAAFCGVYGLKPGYGRVSRYGLVAYASSLECIGITSFDLDLLAEVADVIYGQDPYDQSSVAPSEAIPSAEANRIGVLDLEGLDLAPEVARSYGETTEALRGLGYETAAVSLKTLEYVSAAYYTIATAEASANLARYNGVRYGYRPIYAENPEELVRAVRRDGFGWEVKLRILLGTFVLRSGFQEQYYQQAQKIRTLIRSELGRLFEGVDLFVTPVFPTLAFPRDEGGLSPFQQKLADRFTCLANLGGVPALSFPTGLSEGLPTAVQAIGPAFSEDRLIGLARRYREVYRPQQPKAYPHVWTV